jgi:hypothetical protein
MTGPGSRRVLLAASLVILVTGGPGCIFTPRSVGPRSLDDTRISYNQVVKATAEEQLLLNIVRLRYTDTPSSLGVSSIAAQFELARSAQLLPFFTAAGGGASPDVRGFRAVLPQASITGADRPTISYTPLDDGDFTRRLFTPLGLENVLYLAKTTWPISVVFRLYLENLNWVPNAQLASGPTPERPPEYEAFLQGVRQLQILQDKGLVVFGTEERTVAASDPIEASRVSAGDLAEAIKNGLELRKADDKKSWQLQRKTRQPVLHIHPQALKTAEMRAFAHTFHLKPGLLKYEVTLESLVPFPETFPEGGVAVLDLETRSLLQVLYYISHGVDIPPDHQSKGLVRMTREPSGREFDWTKVMSGLFRVRSATGKERPPNSHVAVRYAGRWYYVEATDHESKSTFSLILELSRLEMTQKPSSGPMLTLSVGQ